MLTIYRNTSVMELNSILWQFVNMILNCYNLTRPLVKVSIVMPIILYVFLYHSLHHESKPIATSILRVFEHSIIPYDSYARIRVIFTLY